jgi:hypothetical protein
MSLAEILRAVDHVVDDVHREDEVEEVRAEIETFRAVGREGDGGRALSGPGQHRL